MYGAVVVGWWVGITSIEHVSIMQDKPNLFVRARWDAVLFGSSRTAPTSYSAHSASCRRVWCDWYVPYHDRVSLAHPPTHRHITYPTYLPATTRAPAKTVESGPPRAGLCLDPPGAPPACSIKTFQNISSTLTPRAHTYTYLSALPTKLPPSSHPADTATASPSPSHDHLTPIKATGAAPRSCSRTRRRVLG